ncbi:hypothetical protein BJX66DRAFT_318771, partial [Aspergillus keveii]
MQCATFITLGSSAFRFNLVPAGAIGLKGIGVSLLTMPFMGLGRVSYLLLLALWRAREAGDGASSRAEKGQHLLESV